MAISWTFPQFTEVYRGVDGHFGSRADDLRTQVRDTTNESCASFRLHQNKKACERKLMGFFILVETVRRCDLNQADLREGW